MSQIRVHDIIEHMIHAEHTHRALCDRELASLGLYRSQLRMLMHLWRHGGAISQRALAEEMHISPAVVTVTLQKLEGEAYVTRTPCGEDRRAVTIALTTRGVEMVHRARGILDSIDAKMLSGLSDEDKNNLVTYYKKMVANMEQRGEGDDK